MKLRWKIALVLVPIIAVVVLQIRYSEKNKAYRELADATEELDRWQTQKDELELMSAACKERLETCPDVEAKLLRATDEADVANDTRCLVLFDLKEMGEEVDLAGCK